MTASFETRSALATQIARFSPDQLGMCARNAMLNAAVALNLFDQDNERLFDLLEAAVDAGAHEQACDAEFEGLVRLESNLTREREASRAVPQRRSA